LLNYLLGGIDLCGTLLPLYELFRLPLLDRWVGPRTNSDFFYTFDVFARLYYLAYAALFLFFSIAIYVANIGENWRKSTQILLFFSMWAVAGLIFVYSNSLFSGFYRGLFVRSVFEFVVTCLFVPLVFMALSYVFRRGDEFIIRRK
jgi:hypothetical protein